MLGVHEYASSHADRVPLATVPHASLPPDERLSWYVELLPYLEQEALYRRVDLQVGWAKNRAVLEVPLKGLQCLDWVTNPAPSSRTQYIGMGGLGRDAAALAEDDRHAGVIGYNRRTFLTKIPDLDGNTMLVLESTRENGLWFQGGAATVRGLDVEDRPYLGTGRAFGGTHFNENTLFRRAHSIACNAAMVDGSVRFLLESVSAETLEAAATMAGGEPPRHRLVVISSRP